MAGNVIGKHMNLGYAGRISRDADVLVENRPVKSDSADIPFGAAVVLNADNSYSLFGAAGTAAVFGGIAVAAVKQATSYYVEEVAYKPNEQCDVLVRGSATVICSKGTPTAGGKVYIRVVAGTVGQDIGNWEAEADGVNVVEITNLRWTTGYQDANDVAEVTILTRVNP